jgi:presequence protease
VTTSYGFTPQHERRIAELDTTARLFQHTATGAQLLSLENDDENKVFGITFFTPPPDSTGMPHILEHSVLCGSRKYPVKEPFVELLKGSLQTFVNAFTFPDKTCYPLASQNQRDFYNLIDVYLDAVFYPRLTAYTLQQEGWHYEQDAPDAPLTYRGVVFNEMKGVYSSPDGLLSRFTQLSLFPDMLYGLDSGGDPKVIPSLTFPDFQRFHQTYYQPANALIYFYGDDDPDERLRFVGRWLDEFGTPAAAPIERRITSQPPLATPRRVTHAYDAGPEGASAKSYVAVNWALAENGDAERTLGLAILTEALIGTPAAPLRKALIDSGLGEDLAGGGLEVETNPPFFSTGLKGVAAGDADKVEALILETLRRLATEGIARETIEAALNTAEFRLREQNTGPFPRGLALLLNALTTWLYGGDPLAPLAFEAPLAAIKARVARGERLFEELLDRYFVRNTHRTTVVLAPEAGLGAREAQVEAEQLGRVRATWSAAELQAVLENSAELKRRQMLPDTPEALATIPMLTPADLDKHSKTIPLAVAQEHGATLLFHDLFTNGILYLDVGLDLHALPQELLPYASIFSRALLGMGTATEDYVTLSQRIGRSTGGIETATFSSMTRQPGAPAAARLFLRGKATVAQAHDLLAIVRDVLLTVKLDDRERLRQIVLEEKAGAEAELVPRGHMVALRRLRAAFNEADWALEQLSGVTYLLFLRGLVQRIDSAWPAVLQQLEVVRQALLNRNALLVNATLDARSWASVRPTIVEFLGALPAASAELAVWTPTMSATSEGLAIPAQVNYVAKGANLYTLGYTLHGSQLAATNYLRTTHLWERVRVQGGAYGGFCLFDTLSGIFCYLSYRDPNLLATVAAYDDAARFLRESHLSTEELTRSIIGAVGALDSYQLPDAKGYTSMQRYLTGETDELRQRRRDELLAATPEDFQRFGEALERLREQGRVVVVGSLGALEAANAERPAWLHVTSL